MSKMIKLVQEMHARLNEIANSEQAIVRALGLALSRVDQRLLQGVREITAEHEGRRSAILLELESLASRIGAFPVPREPVARLANSDHVHHPVAPPEERQQHLADAPWPAVVTNMQEEIDLFCEDQRLQRKEVRRAAVGARSR